ncbi:hypothetical protein BKG91_03140 [Rodentibacter caecimuris]|uniref:Uncharacterized protein n=1 Tax=Rodentibacter caecimuris TaxID=1796644 RepID=A0A9X8W048_9PAST|nr:MULTISPECIES: hypothetical protein [Pasteurellaceae]AOF53768.1 hypothetical protein AC062_1676 [Pasteurellaceae bacterium NI1060]MCQ9124410.1 hypothetical protein [Rodentibacter heylii]MCR1838062.1 hypothetical protein [Pasteurella caecimuris]MCU0107176.1 hypothetical protein [Pasteurella caecimuris]MCX2962242.1 hypothetical protein [Rodentibacter heylii]
MQNLSEKHFSRSLLVKLNMWITFASGILLIFFGLINQPMFLFFGLINTILGILQLSIVNKPIISLMNNHIQIKSSPLSSTKYIKYDDIQSVENKKGNLIFHLKTNKKERLVLNMVQKEQQEELVKELMSINHHIKEEKTDELSH